MRTGQQVGDELPARGAQDADVPGGDGSPLDSRAVSGRGDPTSGRPPREER